MTAPISHHDRLDPGFANAIAIVRRGKFIDANGLTLPDSHPKLEDPLDRELVESFRALLTHLRPGYTWAECDRCGRRRVVNQTASATKCDMSSGCGGQVLVYKTNTAKTIVEARLA